MDSDEKTLFGCIGALVVLVVIIGALLLPTHEIKVQVTDTYWVRENQIENYIPRKFTSWEWEVPSDAYAKGEPYSAVYSSYETCTKIGKTNFCTTHHIYRNKVDYTADRWGYERSLVVNGNNNDPRPFWPAADFIACTQLNCERWGGTTERYTITYERDDKSTFTCDTTDALYGEYQQGQSYSIDDGAIVHIPRCDTIRGIQ